MGDTDLVAIWFGEEEASGMMGDDDLFRVNIAMMVETQQDRVIHRGRPAFLPLLSVMNLPDLHSA